MKLIGKCRVSIRRRYEMAEIKYKPVDHDHEAFLKKASKRNGFRKAYEDLEEEYKLTREMLSARSRFGLTQEAVAAFDGDNEKCGFTSGSGW
jgi:hypothetical protein